MTLAHVHVLIDVVTTLNNNKFNERSNTSSYNSQYKKNDQWLKWDVNLRQQLYDITIKPKTRNLKGPMDRHNRYR